MTTWLSLPLPWCTEGGLLRLVSHSVSSSCSLLLVLFPSGFLFSASNAYWSFSFRLQCYLPISWPSMSSIRVNRSLLSTPEGYLMLHQRFACHVTVYKRFSQQWFHLVLRRTLYMNNNSRLLNIRRFIICLVLPTVSLEMRRLRHTVSNWQRAGPIQPLPGFPYYLCCTEEETGQLGLVLTTSCHLWWAPNNWDAEVRLECQRYKGPEGSVLSLVDRSIRERQVFSKANPTPVIV